MLDLVLPRGLRLFRREASLRKTTSRSLAEPADRVEEVRPLRPLSMVHEVQETDSLMPVDLDPVWSVCIDHQTVGTLVLNSIGEVYRPFRGNPMIITAIPTELRECGVQTLEEHRIDCPVQVGVQIISVSVNLTLHSSFWPFLRSC